ncbi:hypothetical protein JHK85_007755 [Glycine max]|nr:hypothetical protein JHK85_007755 [Glycine max]
MAIKDDVEEGMQKGVREPLVAYASKGHPWMSGYSSPTQDAIRKDFSLSLAEAKRGRQKDFVAALQILRGKDADISEEAEEIQIVTTGLGAALIDKAGRKPLLLISGSGLVVGCMFAAVAFYLKVHEVGVAAVPALAVMGILKPRGKAWNNYKQTLTHRKQEFCNLQNSVRWKKKKKKPTALTAVS